MISGAILLPLTVLKTRFEWGGAQQGHFAMWRTAKYIVQHETVRGSWRGTACPDALVGLLTWSGVLVPPQACFRGWAPPSFGTPRPQACTCCCSTS